MERLSIPRHAMYDDENIARRFAQLENNPGHEEVSAIMDEVIARETQHLVHPLSVADLGGGAHPDRYHRLFERLLMYPQGRIDWVDRSSAMLTLADEILQDERYRIRHAVLHLINQNMLEYLADIPKESLDLILLKYALNYLSPEEVELLFGLVKRSLKGQGRLIATVSSLSGQLKSMTEHARSRYRGHIFPPDEFRSMDEGERYTIHFFKKSGDPSSGILTGAETTLYYHSRTKLETTAVHYGFTYLLGNWKKFYPASVEARNQDILVLKK